MYTEINAKAKDLFSTINFQNENMSLDVEITSNRLYVAINETKERWLHEIVKVTFSKSYYEKKSIDFNYGSGGWNAGDTIVQLGIMQEAFTAAKIIAQVIEENEKSIIELMKEYKSFIEQQQKEYEENNKKSKQESIEKINKLIEDKKVTRIFNIEDFIARANGKSYYCEDFALVDVNSNGKFFVNPVNLEVDRKEKTVYRINGKRFSINNFSKSLTDNYIFIQTDVKVKLKNRSFYDFETIFGI